MKASDIPYNMEYEISDEDLREFPVDADQMQKGVELLKSKLGQQGLSELESAALMSQIGVYSRIVGDLDTSENMLINTLHIYQDQNKQTHVLHTQLRLATTLQWKGNFTKAEKYYNDITKRILAGGERSSLHKFLDFAYQHHGKCLFEKSMYKDALEKFMQAMELRVIKGDLNLIQSTEHALKVVRTKF